jgi:hypothetical protein
MKRSIPPRLRAPALLGLAAVVAVVLEGATHGWSRLVHAPGPLAILAWVMVIGVYVWSRRDSDIGAVLRRQPDERQVYARLRVQALVGRVLSVAVAVGYVVASATKAMLWPWAVLLGLVAAAFFAGWLMYGERGGGGDSGGLA